MQNKMRLNKIKLRKIVHKKKTYLWKRTHYHLEVFQKSKCAEQIIIYLENFKNTPIKLYFKEDDNLLLNHLKTNEKWMVGYPDAGIIWKSSTGKTTVQGENSNSLQINLNKPKTIIKLIDYYKTNGWNPENSNQVYEVHDALIILEIIDFKSDIF